MKKGEYAPKEVEWRKGKLFQVKLDEDADVDPGFGGIILISYKLRYE